MSHSKATNMKKDITNGRMLANDFPCFLDAYIRYPKKTLAIAMIKVNMFIVVAV